MLPRRALYASTASLLFLSLFLAPAAIHGTTTDHLLITEVFYDPVGAEPAGEWLEVYNPTGAPVSLAGWKVRDNQSEDLLPEFLLSPGEFLVIAAARSEFLVAFPSFAGDLLSLESSIGGGLANGDDQVVLLDSQDAQVDAVSYGSDTTAFSPPCPGVSQGQSLGRWPNDTDTDSAADWTVQSQPSPGSPAAPAATPTPTPTATEAPTATSTSSDPPSPTPLPTYTLTATPGTWAKLLITEVEYDAIQGGLDSDFEWVELLNATATSVSLEGWRVADASGTDTLPAHELPPGAYVVIAARAAGFATNYPGFSGRLITLESPIGTGLNNAGDAVKLLAPDGLVVDALSYGSDRSVFDPPCPAVPAGQSLARQPGAGDTDSASDWLTQDKPNPGTDSAPATSTPTSTFTTTPALSATPSPTASTTPESGSTPTATTGPDSPTPTSTGTSTTYLPLVVRLNEILPAPSAVDWNKDGAVNSDDEWLELHNRTEEPVDLTGWQIDDVADGGSKPFALRAGTVLPPHGFMVVYHAQSGVSMNNDGDTVRLLTPEGKEADVFHYGSSRPDRSFSRISDDLAAWTGDYSPSPGAANVAPTPTPIPTPTVTGTAIPHGVSLNEVLPDSRTMDWDADGTASWKDEWVELFNARDEAVALGGWQLLDSTHGYTIPPGTVLWPHGYLLLFRRQTGLTLSDWRDSVTLVRPDGRAADQFSYDAGPGADRSYCRVPEGVGTWTRDCEVTPGGPNRLLPPPAPAAQETNPPPVTQVPRSVASARAAKEDSRVVITGTVTLPPGLIDQTIYLEDSTGGIKVYLRKGEYPALKLGDQVRVTGWTRTFYGETEISVPDATYMSLIGPGKVVVPKHITSTGLVEANEGQLVQVVGAVIRYEARALVLKDRGGLIRVYFPESLPWRRPYVQIGQTWAAQGVLGQSLSANTTDAGYRIIPRFKSDVMQAPEFLPVTGGLLMP